MLWLSLDDPPSPQQVEAWTRIRAQGRRWFITRALLLFNAYGMPIWLAMKVVLWWLYEREMNWSEIEFVPALTSIAWLNVRSQWATNERIYWAAMNQTAIAPGNPPHWPRAQ